MIEPLVRRFAAVGVGVLMAASLTVLAAPASPAAAAGRGERRGSLHAAILNVDQARLVYWNRTKSGRHYLLGMGYNNSGRTIMTGDVAASHVGTHTVRSLRPMQRSWRTRDW